MRHSPCAGHLPFEGREKADIKRAIALHHMRPLPPSTSPVCADFLRCMLAHSAAARPSAAGAGRALHPTAELLGLQHLALHAALEQLRMTRAHGCHYTGVGPTPKPYNPASTCADLLRHPYLALHMPAERLPYAWAEAPGAAVPPAGPLSLPAAPAMLFEPATPPRHAPRSERTADSGMSLDSAGTALPSGSGEWVDPWRLCSPCAVSAPRSHPTSLCPAGTAVLSGSGS